MTVQQTRSENPIEQQPRPPFPEQQQPMPGFEDRMRPRADHGEESYRGAQRLTGKKAIVTGADSGIGKAVALAFAREGADVLVSYLPVEEQDAQDTRRLVEAAGREALLMPGDLADERVCRQLIERAVQQWGRVDILVNNAAFQKNYQSITEIDDAEWDHTFRVNLYAMFYLCKAAVPHMPPGGTIVNTASIQAYQPSPSLLPYATTKGAIVTFTKALAQELMPKGIRVNAVAPGPVWTPLIASTVTDPEQTTDFGKETPAQRPAQPAELAPTYVFLASQESSYIASEVIGVTGGKPLA